MAGTCGVHLVQSLMPIYILSLISFCGEHRSFLDIFCSNTKPKNAICPYLACKNVRGLQFCSINIVSHGFTVISRKVSHSPVKCLCYYNKLPYHSATSCRILNSQATTPSSNQQKNQQTH